MERLEQQMQFILEVDKLKQIGRQTYISGENRKENDAEHSWHLALMAFLLAEHANTEVDVLHVMKMVLIHDLVEIDAGDTYAYDSAGNATKRQREEAAATRIFGLLPKDQENEFWALWEEFEEGETPEAKYALALDKIQPMMLNDASEGRAWREHGVYRQQIEERNKKTPEGSASLWEYGKQLIQRNVDLGNIK